MNASFKYQLDSSSKKFVCPNCNKKTFVRYIDVESKEYLEENLGRCDREQKCGYFKRPDLTETRIEHYQPKKIETSYISLEVLESFYLKQNKDNLRLFLESKIDKSKIYCAYKDYLVSATDNGSTVFWQIDLLERVRSGKIMQYNPETGKRLKDKNGKAYINWIHSFLKLEKFNLKQCLFGLHLSKENKSKTIAVVESEKTAIIMSVFCPQFIWMATGSKNGFKQEYLYPIKLRKIIGFPDKGCYDEWVTTSQKLNELGFSITVNDFLEKEDCELGEDIADIYMRA